MTDGFRGLGLIWLLPGVFTFMWGWYNIVLRACLVFLTLWARCGVAGACGCLGVGLVRGDLVVQLCFAGFRCWIGVSVFVTWAARSLVFWCLVAFCA